MTLWFLDSLSDYHFPRQTGSEQSEPRSPSGSSSAIDYRRVLCGEFVKPA